MSTIYWNGKLALVGKDFAVCAGVPIEAYANSRIALTVLTTVNDLREETEVSGTTGVRGFKTLCRFTFIANELNKQI